MDMSTIIHASITLLGMGLLFYYFKNRISVTEQKVNLMFQLIQEHEKQSSMQVMHPEQMFQQMPVSGGDNGLINVSDDDVSAHNDDGELSECSDDIEEESDDDSEEESDGDKLVYGETLENPGDDKIIKLNLTGSETTNEATATTNDSLEEMNVNATLLEHSSENDELGSITLSENEDDIDNDKSLDNSDVPLDYKKATVAQLKELCESKNLSGYKNLRKPALIELLQSS